MTDKQEAYSRRELLKVLRDPRISRQEPHQLCTESAASSPHSHAQGELE